MNMLPKFLLLPKLLLIAVLLLISLLALLGAAVGGALLMAFTPRRRPRSAVEERRIETEAPITNVR